MSNPPPPPFQVPDDNDPAQNQQPFVPPQVQQNWQHQAQPPGQQAQHGPPQGDPQAFTPPYGQPTPYNPQQPQAPQTPQWQPPQQAQQWQPPQQDQQWQPPQQDQQFAPPPGPQAQSPQPPYVPPQPFQQPQWSNSGGLADTSAAGGAGAAGAAFSPAAMPPPMGPPSGFDSGPGSSMPPAGPPTGYRSGPGHGSGFPPPAAPPPGSYGPPARPQEVQLGPPRAPRPRKHKRSYLLPTAVAALLVAAVTAPAAIKQAERNPTATNAGKPLAKGEVLWSIREGRDGPVTPQPPKSAQPVLQRPGTWYTDQNVVIAEAKRLAAYDLGTGQLAWEYSSDGQFVCDVDLQGDSKQAFVAFGDEKACENLEAIDVVAGKKIWSAKLEKASGDTPDLGDFGYNTSTGIAVSGGVAVFDGQAFRASDGRKLWSADTALGEDCSISTGGFAGGARLVVIASCGGYGGESTAMELDPTTGRPRWQFDVPAGGIGDNVEVVSTDPVMIMKSPLLLSGASSEITVLDDQGREAFKITDGNPVAAPRGSTSAMSGTIPILATDKVIYVPGSDRSGELAKLSSLEGANQLTAYDRGTGQKLWTQSVASGSSLFTMKSQGQIFPIRVEDSGDLLLLVQDGGATRGRPMNLIRVAAKDGSMTNLKELPNRATVAKGLMYGVLVHEKDGRVYVTGYPVADNPAYEALPIKNALGQAVHYDMSSYRVIAMQ
ncbi:PQQ-like beta-propeller repeat protein [Streptomycetaceae bacterium NBC_01309]